MTDVSLFFDDVLGGFDLALSDGDLSTEDGLNSAIYISLFTDARANPDDTIPDGSGDPRGFWGDAFASVPNRRLGSRLWLLSREVLTPETQRRARDYTLEALNWLIEDGIAKGVEVTVERVDPSALRIAPVISRPDGTIHRYEYLWRAVDGL